MSAPATGRGTRGLRFTESVDWAGGRVSATGRLTSAAVDLLAGTTEQLRRAGHARITVELHGVQAPDGVGSTALRAVADDLRSHHCQLVVLWNEKENTP
jgi:anti-anti-sigma regulatory factor